MNNDDFEATMRSFEGYHSLRLLPETWTVVRVDGHGFSRFTETHYEKPFDVRFRDEMIRSAQALLDLLHGIYAYAESDEISILFRPEWNAFDRKLEKIVSLSAGIVSATFTHACGQPAHFDSRVWVGIKEERVADYFRWRQSDAARCALNGWCYWTLRRFGKSVTEATKALDGLSTGEKHALLLQHGTDFEGVPPWQRHGIGLYWENYDKAGFNPITEETVTTTRRRIKVDLNLPTKEHYSRFIRGLMQPRPKALYESE
jgi:tRNA(His) 5'-end guanylyltransferase